MSVVWLNNKTRRGRSKSVVVPKNIGAVQKLIMQDGHVIYCENETALGISSIIIYKILHERLGLLLFPVQFAKSKKYSKLVQINAQNNIITASKKRV